MPLAQIAPSALVWVWAEGVGQLGSRVAREVERDSRCHSQGHTHPHWALGEPVNDCSSVLLTFYCTTYVSSIDGLVLVRVGASLKPHTRRHSLLRRGLARGGTQSGTDTSIPWPAPHIQSAPLWVWAEGSARAIAREACDVRDGDGA